MLIDPNDPFYELPRIDGLNTSDLSWTNRRAYSHGRFTGGPEPDQED